VIHTLILTRDTNEIRFREIGWEIPVVPGRRPRSLFNTAAETPSLYAEVPLGDDAASAYLFQAAGEKLTLRPHPTRRRWFAGPRGEYRYVLATSDRRGHSNVVKNGERMGDWMALAGDEGGLVMACRDASRQHPKEFEVFPDRLAMRLFSHRGGDELDFRFEALVQRWGLTELDEDRLAPEDFKTIAAHESNAIGWSRTHELLVSPLPSEDPAATAVQLGRRHSREVFAHVDPHWIHRSRAMGPVYPKNTERFPEAERMVEHYMREYGTDFTPDRGYLGFVDYFAGPHYYYPGRWHQVYDVLTGYWTAYARSGDRDYRRIARGAAHAYFDCRLAHCDGPNKVRGLINYPGGAVFTGKSSLPYYWGDYTNYYQGNSSDLQRLLWDYYLTGYRRSRDLVEDYGEGLLRAWRPGRQVFCIRYVVRMLYQTYELTFDPRLRVLAEATASKEWYEPASEVLGTKNQPYRCTLYKTPFDMDIPVEIWRLTGARRYGKMAQAQARHNWRQTGVAGRQSGLGANFYYDQTGSPRVAADLFHFLRKQAGDSWQPEDESYIGITWSNLTRVMRGIPYAMDVVAATDADRKPLVSMLDFEVEGDTSKVFFSTDAQQATDMLLRRPAGKPYGTGLALVCHAFHGRRRASGQMLYRVTYSSSGSAEVRVPYDAMPGTYEIGLERPGPYTLIADRRTPLVVNPAGPWKPAYTRPGTKFYFKVPAGATEARIRFENGAILYGPDDIARNGGKPVRDWYELPGDNPGLWAFELTAPGAVEGHNFPAFFAMDDQSFYFEPEIVER